MDNVGQCLSGDSGKTDGQKDEQSGHSHTIFTAASTVSLEQPVLALGKALILEAKLYRVAYEAKVWDSERGMAHTVAELLGDHYPTNRTAGIRAIGRQLTLNSTHVAEHLPECSILSETRLEFNYHQRTVGILAQDIDRSRGAAVFAVVVNNFQPRL